MVNKDVGIEKIFMILRARARLVITILTAAVLIAGIITYLSPRMYLATVSLNFEFSTNPVDTRGRLLSDETYLSTQIDIIESQSVAQGVENSLTEYEKSQLIAALDARFSVMDKFIRWIKSSVKSFFNEGRSNSGAAQNKNSGETLTVSSAYDVLIRTMGTGLAVEPMINSRIVNISYMSADPRIAALMANRYADAYIATSLRMITDPAQKSKAWFDTQLKTLRHSLEEAQAKLTAYQQKKGIVSSNERLDFEMARLQDLSSQLVVAQQTTRNAATEQRKLQDVINSNASLMTFSPVFDNPVVQNIKSEIRSLKASIAEKSSSLGSNHPDMKKLNSELYSAQKRLDSEVEAIIDGINNSTDLSREREQDLEETLKGQKAIVLELKSEHDQISVLQREVESAQATYNAALNQLNTTSMQSLVDQTNVSIIDRANIPTNYASPRILLNLAIGAFGGLLLGVSLAVFLELIIRRVHTKEEIIAELDIPLLGHLKNI
jgi:uncharacterized protein involved in exopolysaccharide biosynthesis